MSLPIRLSLEERQARIAAEWPVEIPTLRQWIILFVGWLMGVVIVPVVVLFSATYGALVGFSNGAFKGVQECYRVVRRWMQIFEDGR